MAEITHIIVQAGGKGTRMKRLTKNKPKALVPVDNLPMIFHLFKTFPDKRFIIIGDYKYEVLEKYLQAFADVDYSMVCGTGSTGTCAGLNKALELIPELNPFMLIWSDLVLPKDIKIPDEESNIIGISKDFRCRWSYSDGELNEEPSVTQGVAGCFVFKDKSEISDVPDNGEFVKYLKTKNIDFAEIPLSGTHEYGLIEEYSRLPLHRCRPFNKITVKEKTIIKEGIDEQGRQLAVREKTWYKKILEKGFHNIPQVFSFEPFEMELIQGKNIYEYDGLTYEEKRKILEDIIGCLKAVHSLDCMPSDLVSYNDAYIDKTIKRLDKVRGLVPFADKPTITINGRSCRNIFFHWDTVKKKMEQFFPSEFKLIHGDCTFSNIMLRDSDHSPVLIDPRGYFGKTELMGDTAYEWAKLYYSIVGNYDRFNLKKFNLSINEENVEIPVESNGWEQLEEDFFSLLNGEVSVEQVKLIHSIIWLSLTTYAWEDYDSICGAFYNGLYYLEEVL